MNNKNNTVFDHENNIFHKAIGFTVDEMTKLLDQAKKIADEMDEAKKSVVVEEILNTIKHMNHREVSVVIFLLLEYTQHKMGNVLTRSILKMMEMGPPLSMLPSSDDNDPSYM